MRPQGFQRVVIPLEFFVRQHRVNLFVTRSTEVDQAAFHVTARKIFFVLFILVPRTRDEMVFRDLFHLAAA